MKSLNKLAAILALLTLGALSAGGQTKAAVKANAAAISGSELVLTSGPILRDYEIKGMVAGALRIWHRDGIADVQLRELPPALRERYKDESFSSTAPTFAEYQRESTARAQAVRDEWTRQAKHVAEPSVKTPLVAAPSEPRGNAAIDASARSRMVKQAPVKVAELVDAEGLVALGWDNMTDVQRANWESFLAWFRSQLLDREKQNSEGEKAPHNAALQQPEQAKQVQPAAVPNAVAVAVPPKRPKAAVRAARSGTEKHWITRILGDGALLELDDGSLWEVEAIDRIESSLWLPMTDVVLVNEEKIISLDDKETIEVSRAK